MTVAGTTVVRGAETVAGSRQLVGLLAAGSRRVVRLAAGSMRVVPLAAGSKRVVRLAADSRRVARLAAGSMPAAEVAADGRKTVATVAESTTSAGAVKAFCNMPGESGPCSLIGVSVKLENNVRKFNVLIMFLNVASIR